MKFLFVFLLSFFFAELRSRDEEEARFVCLRCDLSPGVSFRDIFLSRGIELLSLSLSLSLCSVTNKNVPRETLFSDAKNATKKREKKRETSSCRSFVAQRKKRIMMLFVWYE